jgi:hypothetical protein
LHNLLQFLEFYRCREPVSRLSTLPVVVVGAFDVSPNGDDVVRSWNLQDQVSIMRDCHKFGECRLTEKSIVCGFEISNLELQVFSTKNFPSPESHRNRKLAAGSCCRT